MCLGRAAPLVLLTQRDREAGLRIRWLRLLPPCGLSLTRSAAGGFLPLSRVGLDTRLGTAGVWPRVPQGLFCPVIGYLGGGDVPCVERADQHAGEDVRVC